MTALARTPPHSPFFPLPYAAALRRLRLHTLQSRVLRRSRLIALSLSQSRLTAHLYFSPSPPPLCSLSFRPSVCLVPCVAPSGQTDRFGVPGWDVTVYVPTPSNSFQDFPSDPSARQTFSRSIVPYPYLSDLDFAKTFPGIPADQFALTATSTIAVGAGSHRFCTTSDDGSWLYVDDVLVVDNGGFHGAKTVCQDIQLSGGFHTITVNFMEGAVDQVLQVSMDGSLTATGKSQAESPVMGTQGRLGPSVVPS